MVTVDHVPLLVHGQATIGVAVEGEAHVQVVLLHQLLQVLDMGGAAVLVDVEAVRRVAHHVGIGAQGVEHALGDLPGRAVGGVQSNPHVLVGMGGQADEVADVAVAAGSVIDGLADVLGSSSISPSRYFSHRSWTSSSIFSPLPLISLMPLS